MQQAVSENDKAVLVTGSVRFQRTAMNTFGRPEVNGKWKEADLPSEYMSYKLRSGRVSNVLIYEMRIRGWSCGRSLADAFLPRCCIKGTFFDTARIGRLGGLGVAKVVSPARRECLGTLQTQMSKRGRPNPAVNRTPAGVAGWGARFVGAGYLTR